jgi:hypothetical protein
LEENVVDLPPYEGPQAEELAVDAVQRRLEQVPLPRVLAVEQGEQVHDEHLVDILLGDARLELDRLETPEEELVDEVQVRPARLQARLVLLRVESGARCAAVGRQRPEEVGGERGDELPVHGLRQGAHRHREVLGHLLQRGALGLPPLGVRQRGREVEWDLALAELLHEQLLTVGRGGVTERRQPRPLLVLELQGAGRLPGSAVCCHLQPPNFRVPGLRVSASKLCNK